MPGATGSSWPDCLLFCLASACRDRHLYDALTHDLARYAGTTSEIERRSKHNKGACRDRHWKERTKNNRPRACLSRQAPSEQDRQGVKETANIPQPLAVGRIASRDMNNGHKKYCYNQVKQLPVATGTYHVRFRSCRDRHYYDALTPSRFRSLCRHNEQDAVKASLTCLCDRNKSVGEKRSGQDYACRDRCLSRQVPVATGTH